MDEKERELAEMKEFMQLLTDVKISVAEINVKFDHLAGMKNDVVETKNIATEACNRSIQNEKEIESIKKNDQKKWTAIFTVAAAFVFQIIYFLLTFGFN